MAVRIGHASIDENGRVVGGRIGDQTQKEICVRNWYSKPWNVYLECTDDELADKAAKYMEDICADDNFGYDQGQRTTGYTSIYNNGKKVKGAKGEFDCSSLVASCYRLAGLNGFNVWNTTRNLRSALLKTGKFIAHTDDSYLMSGDLSKRGGIYLKEGSHVVMVLRNNTKKPSNPHKTPKTTVFKPEPDNDVSWVQWELKQAGYKVDIDGVFDSDTLKAVKEYQRDHGLTIDGRVGPATRNSFIYN